MKKKVFLKKILHRDEWRYGIYFDFDNSINAMVRSIAGSTYSSTNNCWHVPCDESTLKSILYSLKDTADIDISAISLPSEKKAAEKVRAAPVPETKEDNNELPEGFTGPVTIRKVSGRRGRPGGYDPVSFSINESAGRLVIRFLGKYDRDWIRELRSYGKLYYDETRKEW